MLPDTSRMGGAGYVDNLSLKGALLHFGVPEALRHRAVAAAEPGVVAVGAAVIKAASDQGARVVAVSATALTMLLISPSRGPTTGSGSRRSFRPSPGPCGKTPRRYVGLRWTMGGVLGVSVLVFLFSPKTIGKALGAENLDIQTPGLWIMASSAGVFCAVALLVCWLVALRRNSLAPELESGLLLSTLISALVSRSRDRRERHHRHIVGSGLQPLAQETELVALGVGQDVPSLVARLPDVGGTGAEGEQPFQLGVLVPVNGVDVDVQGELSGPADRCWG